MPELRPFHATVYTQEAGVAGDLLAPPYDVISADEAEALRSRSPFNSIRLVLPEGEDPVRYDLASQRLDDWLRDGILRRDDEPAVWVYSQDFREAGQERSRHGVFAALRLSEFGEGEVLPHEETHASPREDRRRLMEACEAQLSPVFLVAPDPADQMSGLVGRAQTGAASLDGRTPDGTRHRLWHVPDGELARELCAAAGSDPLLIADGHHRYETALDYHRRNRGDTSAAFVLGCAVSARDPGLMCLPTHRSLSSPPEAGSWRAFLEEAFEVETLETEGAAEAAAEEGNDATMTAVLPATEALDSAEGGGAQPSRVSDREVALLRPRDHAVASAGLSREQGQVAPAVFDRLVLHRGWETDADDAVKRGLLSYHRNPARAVGAAGAEGAAFLLPPVAVDRVWVLARKGERLPPKSTYFWPKLPSGLVFRRLGG